MLSELLSATAFTSKWMTEWEKLCLGFFQPTILKGRIITYHQDKNDHVSVCGP